MQYLANIRGIQETLSFLAKNLLTSNGKPNRRYTLKEFYEDCLAYFKELQYNNRLPKDIDLRNEFSFDIDREQQTVQINFSARFEDFLTNDGNYIYLENVEGVNFDE